MNATFLYCRTACKSVIHFISLFHKGLCLYMFWQRPLKIVSSRKSNCLKLCRFLNTCRQLSIMASQKIIYFCFDFSLDRARSLYLAKLEGFGEDWFENCMIITLNIWIKRTMIYKDSQMGVSVTCIYFIFLCGSVPGKTLQFHGLTKGYEVNEMFLWSIFYLGFQNILL